MQEILLYAIPLIIGLAIGLALRKKPVKAVTEFPVSEDLRMLIEAAKPLTAVHEGNETGMSGEAKRHQVYSRLMKTFPHASHKDLALAIEFAVRGF